MSAPLILSEVAHSNVEGAQRQPVLASLTWSFAPGTFTCVAGPSGAGKTTLLSIIAGVVAPTSGTVSHGASLVTSLRPSCHLCWTSFSRRASFVARGLLRLS
jgi:ABC-type sugar transport system ATPase subunit